MTPSDYAAWFGAILALLVFLYQIWRDWNSGHKILASANKNMRFHNVVQVDDDDVVVSMTVKNIGTIPTTIEGVYLKNPKLNGQYYVRPYGINPLPKLLQPGEIWNDGFKQSTEVQDAIDAGGYLLVRLSHSVKPIKVKIS